MKRRHIDNEEGRGASGSRPRSRLACLADGVPPLLAGLLVMAGLLVSIAAVERQLSTAAMHADLDNLAEIRARIESQLNQAANVSEGIAALIEVNKGLDEERVTRVAERMLERTAVIRSIAVAPGNVIRLSVPLSGNEAAIGMDLTDHPVQSASVERAIQTREPVLGGPYELVQGGYAVIHREPVFFDRDGDAEEEYWGLVSTPIEVTALMERAGIGQPLSQDRLAIRGREGLGPAGEVFLGDPALFDQSGALTSRVVALDGEWQLAKAPSSLSGRTEWLIDLGKLVAVLLGLGVMWFAARWQAQQRQLVHSERMLRDVTSNVSDVVFRTDDSGRLIFLSPAFDRITSRDGAAWLGQSWLTLFPGAEERARVKEAISRAGHRRGRPSPARAVVTTRLSNVEGAEVPVELRVERVQSRRLAPAGLVGVLTDLSQRQAFEQLEDLATAVFEGAGDAIAILDRYRKVLAVNPAFERLVGISSSELVGKRLETPAVLDRSHQRMQSCIRNLRLRGRWREELECRLPDGRERVLGWSVDLIRDDRRRVSRYVCVINDVTARHRRMEAMQHQVLHDALTGVLNRTGLEERFEQARQHAIRERQMIALAFVDLNGFKPINDNLGHHVGDEVLRDVAGRLEKLGRREDIVARLGGDEFVVVFYGVKGEAGIERLGESLRECLNAPLTLAGLSEPIHIRASIGFALFPEDSDSLTGLVRQADAAMYQAKEATQAADTTVVFRANPSAGPAAELW